MHQEILSSKPRVGISSCLLGREVRYDGAHKRDHFLSGPMAKHVEWVSVCPELDVGMGVPREPVRLVRIGTEIRMVEVSSGCDWTERMEALARERVAGLVALRLSGYVFKAGSPSCGPSRVSVYLQGQGCSATTGTGLFARALLDACPELPVEDEEGMYDSELREDFLMRVFTRHRWLEGLANPLGEGALPDFRSNIKELAMAHDPQIAQALGEPVAERGGSDA